MARIIYENINLLMVKIFSFTHFLQSLISILNFIYLLSLVGEI
jgi:hypothetical protein